MLEDNRAILPGSFDPVTRGHLDIIRRVARLFRHLHVGVLDNPQKEACFSPEKRIELLEAELTDVDNVDVESFSGLAVQLGLRLKARWIVRGLRSATDAAYELPMAHSNRLCGGEEIETLFLPTSPGIAFISSRLVKQIAVDRGVLAPFVTPLVEKALRERYK